MKTDLFADESSPALNVWHVCSVQVPAELAETVADYLRLEGDCEPVQLERPGTGPVWLEAYFAEPTTAATLCNRVAAHVPGVTACVRRCDARDWDQFWRLHFKARPVGRRLFCCPDWETPPPLAADRRVLRMVPGLSFGTGEHFTTRFALEMIDQLAVPAGACRSLWDVGCGSGILAVAGALLGMAPVHGTDNDPVCLQQARANAERNQVADRVTWRQADILQARRDDQRYDCVCANLFGHLLQQAADNLWRATRYYLVLSGIRETEADQVADTFIKCGAREIVRDGDGEWTGILLGRPVINAD